MALSILIMIGSGWRIYNASPIFGFRFPGMGDPGRRCRGRAGAAQRSRRGHRHRLALRGDVAAGASYFWFMLWDVLSGHFWRDFLPVGPVSFWRDFFAAARFGWSIGWASTTPCRRSPTGACWLAVAMMLLSGIAIWKPVQILSAGACCSAASRARGSFTSFLWRRSCCSSSCMSRWCCWCRKRLRRDGLGTRHRATSCRIGGGAR